jgi:hypothetical protein
MKEPTITISELENLRTLIQRTTDLVEAAKMQQELNEKEKTYYEQYETKLKQLESETYFFGSK